MKKIRITRPVAYTLLIIASLIVGIIIGIIITSKRHNDDPSSIAKNDNFVYINNYEDPLFEPNESKNYVFTEYSDYKSKFNEDILTEKDFKNSNYVLIPINYDSCTDKDIHPTDYSIKGNKIEVKVKYTASCGVCAPNYMYYLLKVDKSLDNVEVNVDYIARNNPKCDPDISYKPIIYLYPENYTNVKVTLGNPDYLLTTYPKYNNSWEVTATPSGKLYDSSNREYYGLYWEGDNHPSEVKKDGFVVKGEDTIKFLEEKLQILGLNNREANEFIIYWLPKLENNKYNYIRFETLEEINSYMPLTIEPAPTSLIRIQMDYKPLDEPIVVQEQTLNTPSRLGFTVVEWGGSIIK